MSFTAIHIPEFPIVAWQRSSPDTRTHACVVVDGVAPQEKVVARCERAKRLGVEHGMTRAQAEAGSTALFRKREAGSETAAYEVLMEVVSRFSPRIEAIACPENSYANATELALTLLLDSSGIGTLFGSATDFARELHSELQRSGFPAGVGSAPDADTAVILARSTRWFVSVDPHSVRQHLSSLPIALLACDAKVTSVLNRWGIRTFGELAALPQAALVSRLGQQGARLQQLARGEAARLLVPEEPEFILSEAVTLDTPVELLESLLFVLSPMLEAILRRARERAYALRSVCLILQLERAEPHSVAVRPATPTQSREVLLKLLNLELQAHPPDSGIVGVTLDAESTQPQTAQRGLFQAQFPEPDKLELLLARLRAIAGEDNVGSPHLQDGYGEDAFTMAPFRPRLQEDADQMAIPSQMPIRRYRPPESVRITCWDDQPRVMFRQGARHLLRSCAGPWRSSGSWWDGRAWDHDLWDVVTADPPQALRLQQDHASGNWFVLGVYD